MMAAAMAEAAAAAANATTTVEPSSQDSSTPATTNEQEAVIDMTPDKASSVAKKNTTKAPTMETTFSAANQIALNTMMASIEKEMHAADEHHDDIDNEA